MSFRRRYLDSLLSADPRTASDLASRRAPGVGWWRRYLASLLDVPAVAASSQRRPAFESAAQVGVEGHTPDPRRTPWALFQADTENRSASPRRRGQARAVPAGTTTPRGSVIASVQHASAQRPGPWRWAVAAAVACVLAGVVTVTFRQPSGPGQSLPAPTPTVGSTASSGPTGDASAPPVTEEPSPSDSTGPLSGKVVWQGTLTFAPQPGTDDLSVVAKPATPSLADGTTLTLCGSTCRPPVIDGELLAPWTGRKPPTFDQCLTALTSGAAGSSVPVSAGRTACFATSAHTIGFFTVLTTSPAVSAKGQLWAV
ncbi:hypothetical protein [Streptacidiphilus anmyonensis]|uniref:hypothetical protein n=1 Tax=Streptacidiphilus anmyonensis TaxID=405782 RepID=UPI0005A5E711|nr:hypothetical protein [Streptacidiphilus anmyonensis]